MDKFIVITWPDILYWIELDGFKKNSLLINGGPLHEEYGDSAYMVRKSWIENIK